MNECICPYTDPSMWLSAASCGYGSGYEPGSMQEWDPDCPVHPGTTVETCPVDACSPVVRGQSCPKQVIAAAVEQERERIARAIEIDANGPRPGSINHRAYAGHFAAIARADREAP